MFQQIMETKQFQEIIANTVAPQMLKASELCLPVLRIMNGHFDVQFLRAC